MKAAVVREHGDFDQIVFELRPVPEPGPGEVRVRVKAAGLNHLDTWVRRGVPGHTFPLPLVLGSDGAGVVDALGAGPGGTAATRTGVAATVRSDARMRRGGTDRRLPGADSP